MVFLCSNQGNFSHATTTRSRTGVDLKVVFLIGLQSTLLKANISSLGLLKMHVTMMRRPGYSNIEIMDKRAGCGHDMEVIIIRICFDNLISKMRFVKHVPRSCDWFYTQIM